MHVNRKKNLRTKELVACFEREWLKSRARLDKITRYTSFMGRVIKSRTASKGSQGYSSPNGSKMMMRRDLGRDALVGCKLKLGWHPATWAGFLIPCVSDLWIEGGP